MKFIAALWGALGVIALLATAIMRLYPYAVEAIEDGLSTTQWIITVVFAIFMLVAEGYRGFQKKFSPRTAARVQYLYNNATPLRTLLAPLFCMGYFHATKKTRIIATCLTVGIILLIVLVKLTSQPWRGIIDVGVVCGLSYGLTSFICFLAKVFTNKDHGHSPETPDCHR